MTFQRCRCEYCKQHPFPILWELSDHVAWFEIPKNGSWSVKKKHPKRILIQNLKHWNRKPCLVVLRDPVDRFLSLYKHYFVADGRRYKKGRAFLKKHGIDRKSRTWGVINNLDKLTTNEEVHHFYPQSRFIDRRLSGEFELISMSGLSARLGVARLNATDGIAATLSKEQDARIRAIYRSDYEFFDEFNFNPNRP